jgi:hypothetical protein
LARLHNFGKDWERAGTSIQQCTYLQPTLPINVSNKEPLFPPLSHNTNGEPWPEIISSGLLKVKFCVGNKFKIMIARIKKKKEEVYLYL